MKAMVFKQVGIPMQLEDISKPKAKQGQLLIKVSVCGICRTDLHILDGDLKEPNVPLVLGHQIVGIIEEIGKGVIGFTKGDKVGVPWLNKTCKNCEYCLENRENLCEEAKFTGYHIDGGFAEFAIAEADFAYHLPKGFSDTQVAPLLCAGLIGYRAYRKARAKKTIGFYGFGAAAHILIQLAIYEKKDVYAFTRKGDIKGQEFAKKMGAYWAGDSENIPDTLLDAVIVFAPVGDLVPLSLKVLKKGGRCILGGIHMSDIPSFPYKDLWGEKVIESVSNLTRQDGEEFLKLATKIPIQTKVTKYPLQDLNQAVEDLRSGKLKGSAVIVI